MALAGPPIVLYLLLWGPVGWSFLELTSCLVFLISGTWLDLLVGMVAESVVYGGVEKQTLKQRVRPL